MSHAFAKEPDSGTPEVLPERPLSTHPNLVTPRGLALIEAELKRLDAAHAAAVHAGDAQALATTQRDLRFWTARRASAQFVDAPADASRVQFGTTVTLERADGRRQTFRIVGEDEADPAQGTLSHVSPLARALFGKAVGDTVQAPGGDAEILHIDL